MLFFMNERDSIKTLIRSTILGKQDFNQAAQALFLYQKEHNILYGSFCELLADRFSHSFPFLPVEFFKNHEVKTGTFEAETVFTSSGTTGAITSRHFVKETEWYTFTFTETFRKAYGNPEDFCFLCLLPSYLERSGSSLVFMAENLIKQSRNNDSGFYLHATDELIALLHKNSQQKIPTVLLGVTFALLDLAEKHTLRLGDSIVVMETGGMKGRRKEMTREELHGFLTQKLGVKTIHSEYGMTELMSQAYSKGNGLFFPPPQMKVVITDINDPFQVLPNGKTGMLNIIDLANIDSCAFIATKDLGKVYEDGSFEVLGRYDHSDVRGCNLLIA